MTTTKTDTQVQSLMALRAIADSYDRLKDDPKALEELQASYKEWQTKKANRTLIFEGVDATGREVKLHVARETLVVEAPIGNRRVIPLRKLMIDMDEHYEEMRIYEGDNLLCVLPSASTPDRDLALVEMSLNAEMDRAAILHQIRVSSSASGAGGDPVTSDLAKPLDAVKVLHLTRSPRSSFSWPWIHIFPILAATLAVGVMIGRSQRPYAHLS